jgi:hypothetical protein
MCMIEQRDGLLARRTCICEAVASSLPLLLASQYTKSLKVYPACRAHPQNQASVVQMGALRRCAGQQGEQCDLDLVMQGLKELHASVLTTDIEFEGSAGAFSLPFRHGLEGHATKNQAALLGPMSWK